MVHNKAMQSDCVHDYRLESGGGSYLTGAYVCRFCSFRISMSDEQFRKHADPRDYQVNSNTTETESVEEDPSTTVRDSFPEFPGLSPCLSNRKPHRDLLYRDLAAVCTTPSLRLHVSNEDLVRMAP